MASVSLRSPTPTQDGLRPVNLKTDLAPLADLIELAFSETMDSSGRAAIREMRSLSRVGIGLNVLAGMNDMMAGIGLGYVWVDNGRLVGNVSIYPANVPKAFGAVYIIANVAVHPEYRGRGIARELMNTSLAAIRHTAKQHKRVPVAILQVERDNPPARRLYNTLGFIEDGTWIQWRRSPSGRPPVSMNQMPYITRRRFGEWQAEYDLAQRLRSEWNGLGWLRPLHRGLFRRSISGMINDFINLRSQERLIIRSQDEKRIEASLWVESAIAGSSTSLTLFVSPDYTGLYDQALLHLAIRRFGSRSPLTIEHPQNEPVTEALLQQNYFIPQRTLVHMRWMG